MDAVRAADWVGLPDFTAPAFTLYAVVLVLPVVLVLVAENVGHVKAVAAMTERTLDDAMGRAYVGDGLATVVAGSAAARARPRTRRTSASWPPPACTRPRRTRSRPAFALLLGISPKFGALVATIPPGSSAG